MDVIYAYCPHCGIEQLDKIYLVIIGNCNRGIVLSCAECNGSIGPDNYDIIEEEDIHEN